MKIMFCVEVSQLSRWKVSDHSNDINSLEYVTSPKRMCDVPWMNVRAGRNDAPTADCGTGGRVLGKRLGQEYFPDTLLIC